MHEPYTSNDQFTFWQSRPGATWAIWAHLCYSGHALNELCELQTVSRIVNRTTGHSLCLRFAHTKSLMKYSHSGQSQNIGSMHLSGFFTFICFKHYNNMEKQNLFCGKPPSIDSLFANECLYVGK